jgi:hypothetical protein
VISWESSIFFGGFGQRNEDMAMTVISRDADIRKCFMVFSIKVTLIPH